MSDTKKCPRCQVVKPRTDFNTDKRGYSVAYCRPCESDYREENREKLRETQRRYRERNRAKIRKQDEERRRKNGIKPRGEGVLNSTGVPSSHPDYWKLYREKNRKQINKYQRERSKTEKYKEQRNARHQKRYKNDPEYKFQYQIMFHLRGVEKRQEFKDIWDDIREIYEFYDIKYHIDHKVPKSWFLKSTPKKIINHLDNLQVIDAFTNQSKHNRDYDPVPEDYVELIQPYLKKKYKVFFM